MPDSSANSPNLNADDRFVATAALRAAYVHYSESRNVNGNLLCAAR